MSEISQWRNNGSQPHPHPETLMPESSWADFEREGGVYANAGLSPEDAEAAIMDPDRELELIEGGGDGHR